MNRIAFFAVRYDAQDWPSCEAAMGMFARDLAKTSSANPGRWQKNAKVLQEAWTNKDWARLSQCLAHYKGDPYFRQLTSRSQSLDQCYGWDKRRPDWWV